MIENTKYDSKQEASIRLLVYFKVIIRQNEIQYFATHILYIYNAEREYQHVGGKKDYRNYSNKRLHRINAALE